MFKPITVRVTWLHERLENPKFIHKEAKVGLCWNEIYYIFPMSIPFSPQHRSWSQTFTYGHIFVNILVTCTNYFVHLKSALTGRFARGVSPVLASCPYLGSQGWRTQLWVKKKSGTSFLVSGRCLAGKECQIAPGARLISPLTGGGGRRVGLFEWWKPSYNWKNLFLFSSFGPHFLYSLVLLCLIVNFKF